MLMPVTLIVKLRCGITFGTNETETPEALTVKLRLGTSLGFKPTFMVVILATR